MNRFFCFAAALMLLATLQLFSSATGQEEEWRLPLAFEQDRLMNLDEGSAMQDSPDIGVVGEMVVIVWADKRGGNWDIYSRTSLDSGTTFGPEVRVDDTSRTSSELDDVSNQKDPRIAIGPEGEIFVVWVDDREGRDLIYAAMSDDEGANFTSSMPVEVTLQGTQANPDITHEGSEAYIVWEDDRLRLGHPQIFSTRTSDAMNFDLGVRVSEAPLTSECREPSVAATADGVHVAWSDDRTDDFDIYVASSYDGGSTFMDPLRVSRDPSNSDQMQPDLVSNSTSVFCVFLDMRYTSADIFMTISHDAGTGFDSEFHLNSQDAKGSQNEPRIDIDLNDNITVAWTSSPGFADSRSDIQVMMYLNNGSTSMIGTANDPLFGVTQRWPAVAIEDGKIFSIWTDYRRTIGNTSEQQQDIFMTISTDSGEEGAAPVLDQAKVTPEVGPVGQKFQFLVRYSDLEGDEPSPGFPQLHLMFKVGNNYYYYPGAPFPMNLRLIPAPDMDYRNGEYFILSIVVEKGLDLYYFISAKARTGNTTEVMTEMTHLPQVDIDPPTFDKVFPEDGQWIRDNIVTLSIHVTDTQSGVDPYSIGYQIYRPDLDAWTSWQSRGTILDIGNGTVRFNATTTLASGKENLVRFRAKDMAGNGGDDYPYAISPLYQVWADTQGPVVRIDDPKSGTTLKTTKVRMEASISDTGAGVDPETIEASYRIPGSSVYSAWQGVGNFSGNEILKDQSGYIVAFDVQLAYGDLNFVRIRATDMLGNQGASGEVQLLIKKDQPLIVDRPPGPIGTVQPRVTGSLRPHITWSAAQDPDGDLVTYRFRLSGQGRTIVEWTNITIGLTYFDLPEEVSLEAGREYNIQIVPVANGLEGPTTSSVLTVSLDANQPPSMVEDMTPKATGDPRPTFRWTPSADPEGEDVFYFIRIWREGSVKDAVPWTPVMDQNTFKVPVDLMMGIYNVNILASDGTDFSPMASFPVSIGVFSPKITPQRASVVVYQGDTVTINLTIENRGFLFDRISIGIDGEAVMDTSLELALGKDLAELVAGGATNITLNIKAADCAKVGYRSLNITAVSSDGVSSYSRPISIRVVDPDDLPKPDPVSSGPDQTDENVRLTMFILIGVLVVVIAGLVFAFVFMDRRMREEKVEVIREGIGPGGRGDALRSGTKAERSLSGRRGKRSLPP